MWTTKDYQGKDKTWYSESDIAEYKETINKIHEICSTVYLRGKEAKSLAGIVLRIIDEVKK